MNTLETIKSLVEWVDKMPRVHSLKWEVEQLIDARDELFSRSMFKVGQKVEIIHEQNITETHKHGWFGARNKLIVGAVGEVTCVDWSKGRGFSYAVKFPFDDSSFSNFNENELGLKTQCEKCGRAL